MRTDRPYSSKPVAWERSERLGVADSSARAGQPRFRQASDGGAATLGHSHLRWASGLVVAAAALLTAGLFAASVASAQAPAPARPAQSRPPASVAKAKAKAEPVAPGTEVVFDTDKGEIVMRLLPDLAPLHSQLVAKTAKAGGYDGTTFHRIIMGGIIQGGDPLSKDPARAARYGQGGLDLVKAEFSDRPFVRGVVGTARKSSPDSGGVQFFVVLREQSAWNGQYTIFAEVTSGIEVADQISALPAVGDKPVDRILIRKATVRVPEAK